MNNDCAHANDRAIRILACSRSQLGQLRRYCFRFHCREKNDRGCTSTTFQLFPALATTRLSSSFLVVVAPPLLGCASISASTARLALSPSRDVSTRLR